MFSAPAKNPDAASSDAKPAAITTSSAVGAVSCFCMTGQANTHARSSCAKRRNKTILETKGYNY